MKLIQIITAVVCGFSLLACNEGDKEQQDITKKNRTETTNGQVAEIFPQGVPAPTENFTGTVWNTSLVADDSVYTTVAGNLLFEARASTNWHSHPAGQILIVVDGEGRHQIEGQPIEIIKKVML
ncbi:hypothetical protein DET49_1386 [Salegentibacter sp. 24]|uniref:hypothetical protein n=1 Tax=Salegentibacter sp. 24 TaxID=2183986 RepID=UPI0010D78907|nr:hypothetical protein [Salegentibacter sp. 24]TDN79343.1 hypothetical protein DET49_1386 [Salegentibacter sp. 24]